MRRRRYREVLRHARTERPRSASPETPQRAATIFGHPVVETPGRELYGRYFGERPLHPVQFTIVHEPDWLKELRRVNRPPREVS